MKILYATKNKAKIAHMRKMLKELPIEILSLEQIKNEIPEILEDGATPLENAEKKALAYFKALQMPLFACDSGLYFENIPIDKQPGVNVRRIKKAVKDEKSGKIGIIEKSLSDKEMIDYYSNLAEEYGGELIAYYKNAICLILGENHIFRHQGRDISSTNFIISNKACKKRKSGFPLDSLSKEINSRCYYMELENYHEEDFEMAKGFQDFFKKSFLMQK